MSCFVACNSQVIVKICILGIGRRYILVFHHDITSMSFARFSRTLGMKIHCYFLSTCMNEALLRNDIRFVGGRCQSTL